MREIQQKVHEVRYEVLLTLRMGDVVKMLMMLVMAVKKADATLVF